MFRGGAPDDDAGLVVNLIKEVALCHECIARRSGIPVPRVDFLLRSIAITVALTAVTRRCAACLETKRTYSLDGSGPQAGTDTEHGNGTRRTIVTFLRQHAGSAYCAGC